MKTLFLSLVLFANAAFANPIATPPVKEASVEKTWEKCVISAGEKFSTVSCAVGYIGKGNLNEHFSVSVPVILPASMAADPSKVAVVVKARLEIGGKVYEPHSITFTYDASLPGDTVKADCNFATKGVPGKSFAMVVSYEQPTINGKVFYLPLFEEGKNPKDFAEFSVSVFPTNGGLLTLESKHQQKATAFATRVTVKPVHNEIIKIGFNRNEQPAPSGGDKPAN